VILLLEQLASGTELGGGGEDSAADVVAFISIRHPAFDELRRVYLQIDRNEDAGSGGA
jgi:hypothetical protein